MLHAIAVVVEDEAVCIASINLTAAPDRGIELGRLTRDAGQVVDEVVMGCLPVDRALHSVTLTHGTCGAVRRAIAFAGRAEEAELLPEAVPMESKLKHLELIQGVINRMASNSFRLKEWSVVLVSAILVLAAREDRGAAALIGLVPAVFFWGLDAHFLRLERLYRALYDRVRMLDPSEVDFSMQVGGFTGKRLTWTSALCSRTLLAFYLAVALADVAASLII